MSDRVEQAVVLAGGKGTRLRPLTLTRPKPLLPVLGRPCVEYVLRSLDQAGVGHITMACGYRSEDLVESVEGMDLRAEVEFAFEDQPAGTAGAVKLLEERMDDTFVVASGDVLADVDMAVLVDFHRTRGTTATMALTRVERPEEFGIVGLDEEGRIQRFKEKPAPQEVFSNLVNAGIYVLEREALSYVPEGRNYDFSKNLFPGLLEAGEPLYGSPLSGMWKDIGRPSDLIEANLRMAERRPQEAIEGAEPPFFFGKGSTLASGSRLDGAVLGENVEVGEGCLISNSLVMDRCRIGEGCRVEGSALGEGCVLGPGSTLIDSVLGDGAVVEPGARLEGEKVEGK
ncbi:MAG: sugar phosphate nucleotidyltransferase [Methanomassiliicoccales archaeon]